MKITTKKSTLALITGFALAGTLALTGCAPAAQSVQDDMMIPTTTQETTVEDSTTDHSDAGHMVDASNEIALRGAMDRLWFEHMEWTWSTVVAFVTGSDGLEATMGRLLENQVNIGDAVKPFYGDDAGNALIELLTEHIELAVPVLVAAQAGDGDALGEAVDEWYRNAEEVGEFLAAANPEHWEEAEMVEHMRGHITQTVDYASALLGGDWDKAIADYQIAQDHMTHMSAILSDGLIAQFPDMF